MTQKTTQDDSEMGGGLTAEDRMHKRLHNKPLRCDRCKKVVEEARS